MTISIAITLTQHKLYNRKMIMQVLSLMIVQNEKEAFGIEFLHCALYSCG